MPQTVLITGASGGIGRATARLFAQNGYQVVIHYNQNQTEANFLQQELSQSGRGAIAVRADVSDEAQVSAMFDAAEKAFGGVDVLVNNAGIAPSQGVFQDMAPPKWDRVFAVNVRGAYLCARRALGHMLSRREGKIINLSSMWGQAGASCEVCYSAAKAAVIGMTKALAKELGPSGITVNCVAPGVVATNMNAHLSGQDLASLAEETPLGRIGTPQEVAAAIWFLASEQGSFFTGQVLCPNGGFVI